MWGEQLTVQIFGLTILGSVIVAAVVAKLKAWLGTTGWINTALALIVGTALGALVYLLDLVLDNWGIDLTQLPIIMLLLQGLFSGGVAAGLWKAARDLGKK